MSKKRVLVAMSGGVDSSVAAALMQQKGYEVIGVTMTLSPAESKGLTALGAPTPTPAARGCCSVWDVTDAEKVAWKLKIPHYVFNLRSEFEQHVIEDFVAEYARGRTPNPCRRCNQHIKFDHLLERARDLDAEAVVTGHYARLRRHARGHVRLLRGKDERKDQSYVLASLRQDQLEWIRFPVGELTKDQVREVARKLELGVADKAESMDLCFIPDRDTAGFLAGRLGQVEPGEIRDTDGKLLGRHKGLPFYTVGQRKGLGLTTTSPRYVLELDVLNNRVVVGDEQELLEQAMVVEELSWVVPTPYARARVQFRAHSGGAPARLHPLGPDRLEVRFDTPQRALTPGQAAVFYHRVEVLGGGTIAETGSKRF